MSILLLTSFNAFAQNGCLYLATEAGISFSKTAHINPSRVGWNRSPNGYDSKLQESEVLGAGLGFRFCPLLSAELMVDRRNSFKYKKYQIAGTASAVNRTRFFNLTNTTIMANLFGYGSGISDCLIYQANNFVFEPFVNVGLGASYNTLDNFHSISDNGTAFSVESPFTRTSLAYQLGIGLQVSSCDFLALALGYRYLDAGKFSSNNYLYNLFAGATNQSVASWVARLKANELYLKLIFFIN